MSLLRSAWLVAVLYFVNLAAALGTPGLVKEKPASGLFVETKHGFMVPYTSKIPGTDVSFELIPIPGGKFVLGSPASEKDRKDDEGPPHHDRRIRADVGQGFRRGG